MAQSKRPSGDEIPEALRGLVTQLAALEPAERVRVVNASELAAATRGQATPMAWSRLHEARGVVSIGGDAIEDTQALYDG